MYWCVYSPEVLWVRYVPMYGAVLLSNDQYKHSFAVPKMPYTQTLSTARLGVQSTPDCQ